LKEYRAELLQGGRDESYAFPEAEHALQRPTIASRLQSWRPVGRVAELGSRRHSHLALAFNMKTFWGIPLWLCALFCFALTLVWCFVWPRSHGPSASGLRFVILRWFHALTWALLTVAATLGMFSQTWTPTVCRILALGSVAAYLTFLAVMFSRIP